PRAPCRPTPGCSGPWRGTTASPRRARDGAQRRVPEPRSASDRSSPTCALLAGVEAEGARECELSELVTDHGFGDVDGNVLAPVVDGNGVAGHVGDDGGAAGPRLDDALLVPAVEVVDLLQQVLVDERPLLQAP